MDSFLGFRKKNCLSIVFSFKFFVSYSTAFLTTLEVSMSRIFQTGPGPARNKEKKFRPGPKENLKFRSEPGPASNKVQNCGPVSARQYFFRFCPRQLCLRDFKTYPFSCLHMINIFFFFLITYFSAIY